MSLEAFRNSVRQLLEHLQAGGTFYDDAGLAENVNELAKAVDLPEPIVITNEGNLSQWLDSLGIEFKPGDHINLPTDGSVYASQVICIRNAFAPDDEPVLIEASCDKYDEPTIEQNREFGLVHLRTWLAVEPEAEQPTEDLEADLNPKEAEILQAVRREPGRLNNPALAEEVHLSIEQIKDYTGPDGKLRSRGLIHLRGKGSQSRFYP